jgi:hypothetical protein
VKTSVDENAMPKNPVAPETLRWRGVMAQATKLFSAYTRAMHLRLQNFKPDGRPEVFYESKRVRESRCGLQWEVVCDVRHHWVCVDVGVPHHLAPKKKIKQPGERIWFNGHYWESKRDSSRSKYRWVMNPPLDALPSDTAIKADASAFVKINEASRCFRDFLRDHCERDAILNELLDMRSTASSRDLNAELSKRIRPEIHARNFIRVLQILGRKKRQPARCPEREAPPMRPRDVRDAGAGTSPVRKHEMGVGRSPRYVPDDVDDIDIDDGDAEDAEMDDVENDREEMYEKVAMMADAIAAAESQIFDIDRGLRNLFFEVVKTEPEMSQNTKVRFDIGKNETMEF